jgi:hypothetical protein
LTGDLPESRFGKYGRAGLNAVSGAVPFLGGILSAAAGVWGEAEQEQINKLLQQWLQMLEDELREKGKTIAEVVARLDMNDETTKERIEPRRVYRRHWVVSHAAISMLSAAA